MTRKAKRTAWIVGLGVGAAALVGGIAYAARPKKSAAPAASGNLFQNINSQAQAAANAANARYQPVNQ
jgi:hypothetical protein